MESIKHPDGRRFWFRWILTIVLICCFIFVGTCGIIFSTIYDNIVRSNMSSMEELTRHDRNAISNGIELRWTIMEAAAAQMSRREFDSIEALENSLAGMQGELFDESVLGMLDSSGKMTGRMMEDSDIPEVARMCLEHEGRFIKMYDRANNDGETVRQALIMAMPVSITVAGVHFEWLIQEFRPDMLNEQLKVYSYDGQGFSIVLDENGDECFRTNMGGENFRVDLSSAKFEKYADFKAVCRAADEQMFSLVYEQNEQKFIAVISPMDATGGYFLTSVSFDVFRQKSMDIIWGIVLLLGVLLSVGAVVTFSLIRNHWKDIQTSINLAIIAGIGDDYEEIAYVASKPDRLKDTMVFYRINQKMASEIPEWKDERNIHNRLQFIAENLVPPEEKDAFIRDTRRDMIMSGLKQGKSYLVDFRINYKDKVTNYQMKFVGDRSPDGEIRGYVVGLQNTDEQVNQRREIENARNRTVIAGLAENFDYVCYIDTQLQQVTRYHATEKIAAILDAYDSRESSIQRLRRFFKEIICRDDPENARPDNFWEQIHRELREHGHGEKRMQIRLDGNSLYYALRYAMDKENPKGIIFGLYSVDEEVRKNQEARELELRQAALVETNERAERTLMMRTQELQIRNNDLARSNEEIVELLGDVVEMRDNESGQHVRRVKILTRILAGCVMRELPEYGLTQEDVEIISSASALHDVGKILISDRILLKPGRLTPEEFDIMKTHTIRGYEILKKVPASWSSRYLTTSLEICRHHHEKYDGRGYPEGLKGDAIPISAQIVSVVDCYDALTAERVYKKAFTPEQAYNMIIRGECGAFSPKLLACFTDCKDEFERVVTHPESLIENALPVSSEVLKGMRILLVDDNPMSLEINQLILEGEGAVVASAGNGTEAVERCRSGEKYDAIIMELLLPGMNGTETTVKIRELEKDGMAPVPVIALSTEIVNPEEEVYQPARFDAFLSKPLVVSELIRALLGHNGSSSDLSDNQFIRAIHSDNIDELTRALNVTAYTDTIEDMAEKIKKAYRMAFAIVSCDIDHLKAVNDRYGHDMGDRYIRNCCQILSLVFDHSEVFRIGGDEFAVILQGEDYEQRDLRMESLKTEIQRAEQLESIEKGYASLSYGIAVYDPLADALIGSVMKRANSMMHENKRNRKKK